MSATLFVWIAVLAPLVGAGVSFLVESSRRAAQVCFAFSLVAATAAMVTLGLFVHTGGHASESAITFWTFVPSYSGSPGNPADRAVAGAVTDFHPQIGMVVDAVSCTLVACISVIMAAALRHASGSLRGQPELRRQLWLISVLGGAGIAVAAAANVFTLLLAWGLGTAATYLVAHPESASPLRARSARRILVWLRIGDLALLLAAAVLWARFAPDLAALPPASGHEISDPYNFANLLPEWSRAAAGGVPGVGPQTLGLLSALVLLAGTVRLGLVPFCAWLLDSTESGPPALAVLMSVATTAAGGVLLLRFLPLLAATPHALTALAVLGALSVVAAGLLALSETDVWRSLGWLAAGGSGFVALALGSGGYGAALFQLATRGFAMAAMVLAVGNLSAAYRSRHLDDFGGSWARLRPSSMALAAGALSAGGAVLLGGFWSLRSVVAAVLHNRAFNGAHHPGWLAAVLLLATVIGLVLMAAAPVRLVSSICRGEPARRRGFSADRLRDAESRCRTPALALGAMAALVGYVGLPGIRQSLLRYALLPGPGSAQPLSVSAYAITAVAGTAGLVLAAKAWAPGVSAGAGLSHRLARVRLRLEQTAVPARLTGALLVTAALPVRLDQRVIDRAMDELGRSVVLAEGWAARLRPRLPSAALASGVASLAALVALVALGAAGHLPGGHR